MVESYEELQALKEEIDVFMELLPEDESLKDECDRLVEDFSTMVKELEIQSLLSGKYDAENCYVSINAGAGGTDAQDWALMLMRMYSRWFEKKNFQHECIEETMGDEAGIKSVLFHVKGPLAYGYCKAETGVHRLVRLSPFNANNKRQTSFAAVDVIPEISAESLTVQIESKDLKIDTYRASGAGGQHVNKTDSAVRITHLPTGLVATSQNSRSQTDNKETAMAILKSRIMALLEKEHKEKIEELRSNAVENAWGNQIRSYVFHPYKMVKDLRTGHETSQVQKVMDGEIDDFVHEQLRQQKPS
jgi:peptide chain release factor 2